MSKTPAILAAALIAWPAAGMTATCYDGKETVPVACLREEASLQYAKGLADACADVNGKILTGGTRPKCWIAYVVPKTSPGGFMTYGGVTLRDGTSSHMAPMAETVPGAAIVPGIDGIQLMVPMAREYARPPLGDILQ